MKNEPPLNIEPQSVKAIEFWAKAIAAFGGMLYLGGFLVTSLYLSRDGAFSIRLLQTQYLLTGFWLIAPILVLSIPYLGHISKVKSEKFDLFEIGISILAGLFMSILLLIMVVLGISQIAGLSPTFPAGHFVEFIRRIVYPLISGFGMIVFLTQFFKRATRNSESGATLVSLLALILMFVVHLSVYITYLHPCIPGQLGGGKFIIVRLVLEGGEKSGELRNEIEFEKNENRGSLDAVSKPYYLLFQGSEFLTVRLAQEEWVPSVDESRRGVTLFIRRDKVSALIYGSTTSRNR